MVAHEKAHGFIACSAGLQYWCQSGGMNEAFADISGIVFKVSKKSQHFSLELGTLIIYTRLHGS